MDLNHEHDRKGLVATILIHSIIFLLMLIWIMGEAKEMEEMAGGVEVSFGEPDAGGATDISQVANTTPTSPSNPTQSTSENDDPVITSDDVDQPVVNNTEKQTQKTTNTDPVKEPTKTDEPTISDAQKAMDRWKNKKSNSDKTSSTGDGDKDGPKGDPGAKTKGPGGSTGGQNGLFDTHLVGFGISNNPTIIKPVGHDGKVIVSFCVDANANLIPTTIKFKIGTTGDKYLRDLSSENLKKFKFHKIGDNVENRCGTITFNYTQ